MWLLSWVKLLESFNKEELLKFELFCQERFIAKWETIFQEWDESNAMYILAIWKIEVFKNIDWRRVVLWVLKAEEILWEMALYDWKWKRTANAIAITDSKLITILSFSVKQMEKDHPEITNKIREIIDKRKKKNLDILLEI